MQYNSLNVKLSILQLNKLKSAIKNTGFRQTQKTWKTWKTQGISKCHREIRENLEKLREFCLSAITLILFRH